MRLAPFTLDQRSFCCVAKRPKRTRGDGEERAGWTHAGGARAQTIVFPNRPAVASTVLHGLRATLGRNSTAVSVVVTAAVMLFRRYLEAHHPGDVLSEVLI